MDSEKNKNIDEKNNLSDEIIDPIHGEIIEDATNEEENKKNEFYTDDDQLPKSKSNENKDEYDTDIEIEDNRERYDHSGKTYYIRQCRKYGVIPASFFLRNIQNTRLDLRHHGLRLAGIKPICESLASNGTITVCDFTDNWLGNQSIPYIANMMNENSFITELNLSNNQLDYSTSELLCDTLATNIQLIRLDLSCNNFDDRSAQHFADLMMNSMHLTYLNLSNNDFGSDSLIGFGKCFVHVTSVEELDLSWNHLTGKEMKHFCSGLIQNKSIKTLNLGWNGLGPTIGAQELGKMLKLNNSLDYLNLNNNRISAEGAVLLGRGLSLNENLKTLKIGLNPMQTAGCFAILTALMKNEALVLKELDFEGILVNQDFRDLEQQSNESHPDLKIITGIKTFQRPSTAAHPMVRLKRFAERQGLSLIDYFRTFDDDGDMTVTSEEFKTGIENFSKASGYNLTNEEIDRLIHDLDKDGDGTVNFTEFAMGVAEYSDNEAPGLGTIKKEIH